MATQPNSSCFTPGLSLQPCSILAVRTTCRSVPPVEWKRQPFSSVGVKHVQRLKANCRLEHALEFRCFVLTTGVRGFRNEGYLCGVLIIRVSYLVGIHIGGSVFIPPKWFPGSRRWIWGLGPGLWSRSLSAPLRHVFRVLKALLRTEKRRRQTQNTPSAPAVALNSESSSNRLWASLNPKP